MSVIVMIAMEEEAQHYKPYLENMHRLDDTEGIVATYRGTYAGVTVDVVVSGIGAVYAAAAMTAALIRSRPQAVISCGCAGAHRPEQAKGDIVIGASVKPLSAQVVDRNGNTRQSGIRCSMLDEATMAFDADAALLRIGTAAARAFSDEAHASGDKRRPRVDIGVVGSSDVWRQDPKVIAEVVEQTATLCEEMEAHALAQVCKVFKVPFLAIKDIANSEIFPEDIQLEPTHSLVPESSPVGVNAASVTARAIESMAADSEWAAKLNVAAGASRGAATNKRRRGGAGPSHEKMTAGEPASQRVRT